MIKINKRQTHKMFDKFYFQTRFEHPYGTVCVVYSKRPSAQKEQHIKKLNAMKVIDAKKTKQNKANIQNDFHSNCNTGFVVVTKQKKFPNSF